MLADSWEGRVGSMRFRFHKNDGNLRWCFALVTYSRSGSGLEVTGLWIRHIAEGNAAGSWKGFWGGFFQLIRSGKYKPLLSSP